MTTGTKFNPELAATVLVDAVYANDQIAAEKWGVSDKSIRNWRKRLSHDPSFAAIFLKKRRDFESRWVDRLSVPIQAAMDFIADACRTMDPRQKNNPEMIRSVADALKVMSDVSLTGRALDAGTAHEDPTTAGVPEEIFGQPATSDLRQ